MRKVNCVLFDLFDTLVFLSSQERRLEILKSLDVDLSEEEQNLYLAGFPFSLLVNDLKIDYKVLRDISLVNNYQNVSAIYSSLKKELSFTKDANPSLFDKIDFLFNILIAESTALPNIHGVLEDLKSKNIKLGMVSNLSTFWKPIIQKHHFDNYFDEIILSCDVGFVKPNKEIYEEALNSLGVIPTETIMIGDNLISDIKGASEIGIKAIWFNNRISSPASTQDCFCDVEGLNLLLDPLIAGDSMFK